MATSSITTCQPPHPRLSHLPDAEDELLLKYLKANPQHWETLFKSLSNRYYCFAIRLGVDIKSILSSEVTSVDTDLDIFKKVIQAYFTMPEASFTCLELTVESYTPSARFRANLKYLLKEKQKSDFLVAQSQLLKEHKEINTFLIQQNEGLKQKLLQKEKENETLRENFEKLKLAHQELYKKSTKQSKKINTMKSQLDQCQRPSAKNEKKVQKRTELCTGTNISTQCDH